MADLTLHDGREVNIDLYKVTRKEFAAFVKDTATEDEEYQFIGKVTGLKADEIGDLPVPDYDNLVRQIILKRRELAANPS